MATIATATSISRESRVEDGQNLPLLQEHALAFLQEIVDENWTDHNPGDPGMTVLEVLTFVISDLSYRLGFPIRDLMAWPSTQKNSASAPFLLAKEILPSNAVTLVDYQKMIMDIEGIRAVILDRDAESGRFNITVDTNDVLGFVEEEQKLTLGNNIRQRFLEARNVNEDIASISFIQKEQIALKLDLVFADVDDLVTTLAEVLYRLDKVISPTIDSQSLEQLLDSGYSADEIFSGTLGENDFILSELLGHMFPQSIYSSDLIYSLGDVDSLETIRQIGFISSDSASSEITWLYEIGTESSNARIKALSLNVTDTLNNMTIELDGHDYIIESIKDDIEAAYSAFGAEVDSEVPESSFIDLDSYQQGRYRELGQYQSLQNEFPVIYKLMDHRLDGEINTSELAQIMQLKGFLTLFDQILADQFAQLETLKSLLALSNNESLLAIADFFDRMLASERMTRNMLREFWNHVSQLPKTKVSQAITDVSGLENLLGDYIDTYQQTGFQEYAEEVLGSNQLDRLNRSLTHLLARYAETTLDANLLQYGPVISFYIDKLKCTAPSNINVDSNFLNRLVMLKQASNKAAILNDYVSLSRNRAGGFDYLQAYPKDNSTHYLVNRILRFLGVYNTQTLPLSLNNKEGIYLIENRLLWSAENYSNVTNSEISFIVPEWTTRFNYEKFHSVLENQVAINTPAHLTPQIIYLDRTSMNLFEQVYYAWLNALTQCPFDIHGEVKNEDGEIEYKQMFENSSVHSARLANLSEKLRLFLINGQTSSLSSISDLNNDGKQDGISHDEINDDFLVGYRTIGTLKTSYRIEEKASINPTDKSKKAFTVGISPPNQIYST